MSPEAWIALGGTGLTLLAIVYYAGKIVSQMENYGAMLFALRTDFQAHVNENDKAHALLFEKTNRNAIDIATHHGSCENYRPRPHGAGGN